MGQNEYELHLIEIVSQNITVYHKCCFLKYGSVLEKTVIVV